MKNVGIRIRVEKELRDSFGSVCQLNDRRASDVLRKFMSDYVEQYRCGQKEAIPLDVGGEIIPRKII